MASKDSKRSVHRAQPGAPDSHTTKPRKPRKRRKATVPYHLRRSHRFEDVRGKIVDFVEFFTGRDFHCVDVRFQDKTSFTFEIDPTFVVEPMYSDWKTGNWRPIKRWPLIDSDRL